MILSSKTVHADRSFEFAMPSDKWRRERRLHEGITRVPAPWSKAAARATLHAFASHGSFSNEAVCRAVLSPGVFFWGRGVGVGVLSQGFVGLGMRHAVSIV